MEINKDISILIVDDFQGMRRMLADILRFAGFKNAQYAEDGAAAWRKMNEVHFDLVFLDWDMPKMNGLQLLEKIRGSSELAQTPVIMVTARAEEERIKAAISTGVTNYVIKPYTPDIIYKKLQQVLKTLPPKPL